MTQTVEQLKQRLTELRRSSASATTDYINELSYLAWELRYSEMLLSGELSAEALRLATNIDYERGRAQALRNIGWYQVMTDQFAQSEQSFEASRLAFDRLSDQAGVALAITGSGIAQKEACNYAGALDNFNRGLQLSEESGNQPGVISALINLGGFYDYLADYPLALEYSYRALQNVNEIPPHSQAHLLSNMGNTFWRLGEVEESIKCSEQSLAIIRIYPNWRSESITLLNIGAAYYVSQQYQVALEYYERGFELVRSCKNLRTEAEAYLRMGIVYRELGDLERAMTNLWQALQLSRNIKSRFYECEALFELGILCKQTGDWSESVKMLEEALAVSQRFSLNEIGYKAHLALSEVYEEGQDLVAALYHYRAFHEIWNQVRGDVAGQQLSRLLLQYKSSELISVQKLKYLQQGGTGSKIRSSKEVSKLPPQKLKQVIEFIKQNLEQNITVAKLAEVVALNEKYFFRTFKQSTGKTPHQYLIEQRIEHAKKLLQTTTLSLSQIAYQSGFSSQSHLTTHFRLTTGATPSKFRRVSNSEDRD